MATVWDVFMQKTEELHEEISHGIAAKAQELGEVHLGVLLNSIFHVFFC